MPALAAPGATLGPDDVSAVIAHLRTLPAQAPSPTVTCPSPGCEAIAAQGSASAGRRVYDVVCAGCHGPKGEGRIGPALANPGFQQAATPVFVARTVLGGREGTPMPAFSQNNASYPRLTETEAADVAAFVTSGFK
jgi:mono/diheme cytochrome c family protein